ncbi:sensor histidine kinase [Rathayibacter sp. YIM 133350]|uniref:sensor histidine kinase n=1 Tax=Rathayibacter sp. YIM 133350 TaxID=3131992 RepID=UPI00307EAADC
MSESVLLAVAAGVVLGIAASAVFALGRRLVRGSAELGTDAERATYTTLHLASRAAEHLRGGGDGASRAGRHLRVLLGCEAFALADESEVVALDGDGDQLRAATERVVEEVRRSGRQQIFRSIAGQGRLDAVGAPVTRSGITTGVVVAFAFAPRVRPGLVRATKEVADWVAAQRELGELDASRAALAEAQLRALRAQISPHFIYNSLNAVASFITTDPEKARDLVLEFADFTRYSFRRQGDFTTVAEELRSIHSYLQLERARFGERLQVSLQIAPEVLSTVIPFLSVQPLVENAVQHGLEGAIAGGRITITATDAGGFAEITVDDDGVGIDPATAAAVLAGERSEHVGLRNVDARLRQVYGEDHGLVVETNLGSGTLVRMRVPKSQPEHAVGAGAPR